MNDALLIELIEVINEEVRTFHSLLTSLQNEQRVLVEDDLAGIEEIVAEQQQLAVYAHQIEARRIQMVDELALRLDLQSENVSLSRLVEVLEGRTAMSWRTCASSCLNSIVRSARPARITPF